MQQSRNSTHTHTHTHTVRQSPVPAMWRFCWRSVIFLLFRPSAARSLHFNTALYIQVFYVKDTGVMIGCFLRDLHHVYITFLYVQMSISEFTACYGVCFRVNPRYVVPKEVFKLFGKNSNIPKGLLHSILLQGKHARNAFFFYYSPEKTTQQQQQKKKKKKKKVLLPT